MYQVKTQKIDLESLNDDARRVLMDFYIFLKKKYGTKEPRVKKLPNIFYSPIKVKKYIKVGRDEIYSDI